MANDTDIQVKDDVVVGLDYVLRLDDGEVVDSSQGRDPLEFIQGRGQIISGLEKELYGMGVGDEKSVRVEAGEAYGEYDDERLQSVPRNAFPDDMEIEEGMSVRMRDSNSGNLFDAYVDEVGDESVTLDFNHPLAGETLHFDVKIASLREASEEELNHGHVHAA